MALVLLLGGARSGKSERAVRLAAAQSTPVTVIATAQARDSEMAARIGRHRAERPAGWATIEEPVDLAGSLASVAATECVIVDDLTLWVSNLIEAADVEARGADAAQVAAGRPGLTLAISNEVGMGIVPANELARRYRDVLGRVNASWAAAAAQAYLLVAGRLLVLACADGVVLP
jgi:adenosyl cobinamide kinase/adenosyl cobinamide phosphate guanylyltransferase